MLSSEDFLLLAQRDRKTVTKLEPSFPDEAALNGAMYYLQQAIEKSLKGLIMIYGEQPEFSHNIGKLIDHANKLGIEFSDNVENIADTLSLWETSCRYDPYMVFSERKYVNAKSAFDEVFGMLSEEINKLKKPAVDSSGNDDESASDSNKSSEEPNSSSSSNNDSENDDDSSDVLDLTQEQSSGRK